MKRTKTPYGLGVFRSDGTVYLFHTTPEKPQPEFLCDTSENGFAFTEQTNRPEMLDEKKRPQTIGTVSDFRISEIDNRYFLVYKLISETKPDIRVAVSDDLIHWRKKGVIPGIKEVSQIVPHFQTRGRFVMYTGEGNIRVAYSNDLKTWKLSPQIVLAPRSGSFDNAPLEVASVRVTEAGIVVLYYVLGEHDGVQCYAIGRAVFDKRNPERLLSRSHAAILSHVEGMTGKRILPIGVIEKDGQIFSYWDIDGEGIVAIAHSAKSEVDSSSQKRLSLVLKKIVNNPILKPIASHLWESKQVFNPAAFMDGGKIHLIYRAIGENDVSVLGYATTVDGTTIDERGEKPIYWPRAKFEINQYGEQIFNSPYMSGGAYGGCEDPRITKIGDDLVMMYVAYDGCNPPRVAMSKINIGDFRARNWNGWSDPVLISKPGEVNKNACVLPEKVNGKYVIFHRVYPHILVDYVDSLDEFDGQSKWLEGHYKINPRPNMWDSRKIGVGAPPIKTDDGWLLIYQSVGEQDSGRYKIGAMLLDQEKPEKVLYRTRTPIIEPDQWYENEGFKYGVAYPCGAVIHEDMLRVYYGGADTVVCEAHAPIHEFMKHLIRDEEVQLYTTPVRSAIR